MRHRILFVLMLLLFAIQTAQAADCARLSTSLISSSQPLLRDPGDTHGAFDGPNDHAIYYGAADWIRDEENGVFLDGQVDFDFGMVFGNGGEHPEGFDRQIKQLHEYRLAPAYAARISGATLESATLVIYIDSVLDMTLSGQTDLLAPEFMYVNVFAGDGLLTDLSDAQVDFERCDRQAPATWDIVFRLENNDGFRISQDEVDNSGGVIPLEIDVTAEVRDLLANTNAFAGFTMAGSEFGDFVLLSVDGGSGSFAKFPRLILEGPFAGDFDGNDAIDLLDFSLLQTCMSGSGVVPATGCAFADLDGDEDVDTADYALLAGQFFGPVDHCTNGPTRAVTAISPIAATEFANAVRVPDIGDFNGDGKLNSADRAHFHACVTRSGGTITDACASSDLNRDGLLDVADVQLFNGIFTP